MSEPVSREEFNNLLQRVVALEQLKKEPVPPIKGGRMPRNEIDDLDDDIPF